MYGTESVKLRIEDQGGLRWSIVLTFKEKVFVFSDSLRLHHLHGSCVAVLRLMRHDLDPVNIPCSLASFVATAQLCAFAAPLVG